MKKIIPPNLQYHDSRCLCCKHEVVEEIREQNYSVFRIQCDSCMNKPNKTKLLQPPCTCQYKDLTTNIVCIVCEVCEKASCVECKTPIQCKLNDCSLPWKCDLCKMPKCIECGIRTNNKVNNYSICRECSLPRCKVCKTGTANLINNVFICPDCHKKEKANIVEVKLKIYKITELRKIAKDKKIKGYSGYNKDELVQFLKTQIDETDLAKYKYTWPKHYIINFENNK